MLFMTFWYQYIDRSWFAFNLFDLITALLALIYFIIWVDESPKWLQQWERFDDARSILKNISNFNGVEDQYTEEMILKKEFDKEYIAKVNNKNADKNDNETVRSSQIS